MIVSDDDDNVIIPATVLEEYSGHGVHGSKPVLLYDPTSHSPGDVGFVVGLNDGLLVSVGLFVGFSVGSEGPGVGGAAVGTGVICGEHDVCPLRPLVPLPSGQRAQDSLPGGL